MCARESPWRWRPLAWALLALTLAVPAADAAERAPTAAETAAIQALWEAGAKAMVARDASALGALANARTLTLIEQEKRLALSLPLDEVLHIYAAPDSGCFPHSSVLRALYDRSLYLESPFFLETVAAEEYLAQALDFTLRSLVLARGDNFIGGKDFGERLWIRPDYPYDSRGAALRDRIETEPGAAWALVGGTLAIDGDEAFLLGADSDDLGLWPSVDLSHWPIATRDGDGQWRLDLRWLLGPVLERALHLDVALVQWRARLAGEGNGKPRWLSGLSANGLTDAYALYLPRLRNKEVREQLLKPLDPWPRATLPCVAETWARPSSHGSFALLWSAMQSTRLVASLDPPDDRADEDAITGLVVRYQLAAARVDPVAAAELADQRSLLGFEALRQATLRAPRSFFEAPETRACFGPYSLMQVLRLRAEFSASALEAMPVRELIADFLRPSFGRGPRSCILLSGADGAAQCVPPSAPVALALFGQLMRGQALASQFPDDQAVVEHLRALGILDYKFIENRAFWRGKLPHSGQYVMSDIVGSRSALGPWEMNFNLIVSGLEAAGALPAIKGDHLIAETLARFTDWTGIAGDETLFNPPVARGFDPAASCFLSILAAHS